jgi:hypothetical protein
MKLVEATLETQHNEILTYISHVHFFQLPQKAAKCIEFAVRFNATRIFPKCAREVDSVHTNAKFTCCSSYFHDDNNNLSALFLAVVDPITVSLSMVQLLTEKFLPEQLSV